MKTRRLVHKLILYFKIVNNHVPEYLSKLLPQTVEQRSGLSLRQSFNISLFFVRTERFKKSFFPSATMLWNSVEYSVSSLPSINLFKKAILKFFDISCDRNHSYFDHSIDRYTSVVHARLRLNCCALNYYLFRINRSLTPDCICGAGCETVAHYL